MKNNIALIIQGPIDSYGLHGASWGFGKTDAPAKNFVRVNCAENINNLIIRSKDLFSKIIISTWENEDCSSLNSTESKVSILKMRDPGGVKRSSVKNQKVSPELTLNNQTRQFQGLLGALSQLQEPSIQHVIKVRTDQDLDILRLFEEFNRSIQINDSGFFIPYFHKVVPWAIPDFFIGGKLKEMIELARMMVSPFIFSENVHRDLFFKGILTNSPSRILSNFDEMFLLNDRLNSGSLEAVLHGLTMWNVGSKELFYSISWRGVQMSQKDFVTFKTPTRKEISKLFIKNERSDTELMLKSIGIPNLTGLILSTSLLRFRRFLTYSRRIMRRLFKRIHGLK